MAVVQEAMRLQPVAAGPLLRVAKADNPFSNGVVIPSGVTIDLAQYTPMRSDIYGWEDGTSFIPVSSPLCPEAPFNSACVRGTPWQLRSVTPPRRSGTVAGGRASGLSLLHSSSS
jgi:hypothetical protein